jgi:hypothetical protein
MNSAVELANCKGRLFGLIALCGVGMAPILTEPKIERRLDFKGFHDSHLLHAWRFGRSDPILPYSALPSRPQIGGMGFADFEFHPNISHELVQDLMHLMLDEVLHLAPRP